MGEAEGTPGTDSTGDAATPIDLESVKGRVDEFLAAAADGEAEEPPAVEAVAPPRRRLVAELLEGQEDIDHASRPDLQLVAPPLHLQTIDAGQPIYQLDLSTDEPEGVIIEPDGSADGDSVEFEPSGYVLEPPASEQGGYDAIKQLIMQRDRQVMAAERDGVGAYALASGVDEFVRKIIRMARDGR